MISVKFRIKIVTNFLPARRLDRPAVIEMTDKDGFNIPGSEWAVFRLGTMSTIVSIDIDTNHFRGNAPEFLTIEGTDCCDSSTSCDANEWTVVLDKIKLLPHKLQSFKKEIKNTGPFNCMRITIVPDGGLSRVRIFGQRAIRKPNETTENSKAETVNNVKGDTENSNEVETPPPNNTNENDLTGNDVDEKLPASENDSNQQQEQNSGSD